MAKALLVPESNPVLQTHPKLTFQKGAYFYTIERRGDQSIYTVADGNDSISLPIRWVFGAHSQTYLLERNGRYYEALVSYYPAIDGLDITTGDAQIHPATLEEAMGRELSSKEEKDCFGCHTTGAALDGRLRLDSFTPGVACEHCHANAGNHLAAISRGKLDHLPPKLSLLSAEDLSNFCGQCHRTWEQVVRNRWFGQFNVRFQPYRLAISKCFDGIDPRIGCVACHDPHREVIHEAKAYDRKCLACHSAGAKPNPASPTASQICPIAASGCVTCHMPKTQLPGAHLTFTDHDIRVVRPNDPFPN